MNLRTHPRFAPHKAHCDGFRDAYTGQDRSALHAGTDLEQHYRRGFDEGQKARAEQRRKAARKAVRA